MSSFASQENDQKIHLAFVNSWRLKMKCILRLWPLESRKPASYILCQDGDVFITVFAEGVTRPTDSSMTCQCSIQVTHRVVQFVIVFLTTAELS
jgi:hypothetical protein